jgi:MFS family permease
MAFTISQMVGNSAAFAVGGTLLAAFGPEPDGWRWTILWMDAPLALVIVAVISMREPPRTGRLLGRPSIRRALSDLCSYRSLIAPLMAGMLMVEVSFGSAYIWGAPVLSRSYGLPPDRVGAILATGLMASGLVGALAGGPLADFSQRSGGPRRTLLTVSGLALASVPSALFAYVPAVWQAAALLVTFMVTVCAVIVIGMTLFTIVVPDELRGLCVSVVIAAGSVFALGVAPLAVSLLAGLLGGPEMIGKALSLISAVCGVVAAMAYALASRNVKGNFND